MQKHFLSPYDESELKTLIYDAVKDALADQGSAKTSTANKPPIKGIHELAKFLGISPSRAQKLKNEGVLKYWQDGRLVFFDPEEVMKVMRTMQKKGV